MPLCDWNLDVIAETGVYRQPGGDLDVILNPECHNTGILKSGFISAIHFARIGAAEEHGSDAVTAR